ncbi:MAG: hypothetical protein DRH37_08460 [Deltaproteobacteria bacterium]|nr:MAG: hypothetical protein DRH37_08460 [Deltaproteobacteria bacterium]
MPDQISLFPEYSSFFENSAGHALAENAHGRNSLDDFFSRTAAFDNDDAYFRLLQFISGFPGYSPLNAYLIFVQKPGSTYVCTAYQWLNKFVRRVNPDAGPILILAPGAGVQFVYDVSDTYGKALPEGLFDPPHTKGKISQRLWRNMVENCARDLIRVYETDSDVTDTGVVRVLDKFEPVQISEDEIYAALYAIAVNRRHSVTEKYAALVYALAHLYCGHIGADKTAWWTNRRDRVTTESQREVEAESISYLVCRRKKIKPPVTRFLTDRPNQGPDRSGCSLDVVLRVAGHIEGMGRRVVKKRRKKPVRVRSG